MDHSLQPSASSLQPRLVIAGLSGDCGKTLISVGLLKAARRAGLTARGFKKGPDYIDAAWLSWAAGSPARNLDSYMMGMERAVALFARHAAPAGFNLIEGNRGLHDGFDSSGTHSTAELAKALSAPVVLALNAAKVTRTLAACVLGCQKLDPAVRIAGVILNRVSGPRHERVLRESIEAICGIPILGVVPRASQHLLLPGRHLGLVTPEEHPGREELEANLSCLLDGNLDLERLFAIAGEAWCQVPGVGCQGAERPVEAGGNGLRIGYLKDSAFTFYYPDNLEALEQAGAQLIAISSLDQRELPEDLDCLYIGGGFPETHATRISANGRFLESLRRRAEAGLPIYAECGGLMLLSRAIIWQGNRYAMAGVLPFEVKMEASPQGHGYSELRVDHPNPFFPEGLVLRGHEFHYSRIVLEGEQPATACAVLRGSGCFAARDAVIVGNVWASYTHLHAIGAPEWAAGLLTAGSKVQRSKGPRVQGR
jgi:cobyrinic acid a,c-diamide synthase